MDTLFKKSLAELVQGIRSNKRDEQQYIGKCIQEIKVELKQVNKRVKAVAVQKLTYIHSMGYDVSWAAFHIIEVMSQPQFTPKRIGYLAASQTFSKDTDVIMLSTNLFRKDLQNVNQYEVGVAINCLSNIVTKDLARDLAPDLVTLLSSSKPYIRRKATLALYKVFLQFPQALRPAFPRLKEKLEDPDPAVVCAAVDVICELASKNPKNYIGLAPMFYKLLTTSTNNWMLIKIIKLFGALTSIEPRLAKKLTEPLRKILNTTMAMSLLYECIRTCTIGLSDNPGIIRICISKLRTFIEHPDQNLKYLGLLALGNMMAVAPKVVKEYKDIIVHCLNDEDNSIRLRALDIIVGLVDKKSLMDIVKKLIEKLHTAEGEYLDHLIAKTIEICSYNSYAHITDFEWYFTILVELTRYHNTIHGKRISDQLLDVCIRVQLIRTFGVKNMVSILQDTRFTQENPKEGGICEVLTSAAFIVGEFGEFTSEEYVSLIDILTHPRVTNLPNHIQSIYLHNALKLFTKVIVKPEENNALNTAIDLLGSRLPLFARSSHLETQERACFNLELHNIIKTQGTSILLELAPLFTEPLNPVSSKAYKRVPIPPSLDLNQQIHTPPPSDEEESSDDEWTSHVFELPVKKFDYTEERQRRAQRLANDPFYIGNKYIDEEIPVIESLVDEKLNIPSKGSLFPSLSQSGHRKSKREKIHILKTEEMPEGANDDDGSSDVDNEGVNDPLAKIDLTEKLKPEEELKIRSYPMPSVGLSSEVPSRQLTSSPSRKRKMRRKHREKVRIKRADRDRRTDSPSKRRRGIKTTKNNESEKKSNVIEDLIQLGSLEQLPSDPLTLDFSPLSLSTPSLSPLAPSPYPSPYPSPASPIAIEERPVNERRNRRDKRKKYTKSSPLSNPTPSSPLNIQLAGENNDIKVGYEFSIHPSHPNKVMAIFHLKPISESLSDFEFRFTDTTNTSLTSSCDPKAKIVVTPSTPDTHRLLFQFKSPFQVQKLSGNVSYKAKNRDSSLNLSITIPCSTFIQPSDITEEKFTRIIETESTLSTSSAQIKIINPRIALAKVNETIHVKTISLSSSSALLFGKSIQNHDVFVLVKIRNNLLNVEIKTPSQTLSSALLKELQVSL